MKIRNKKIGGTKMLSKAILIAVNAHNGQVDKAGEPYILHPLRLMLSRTREEEKICAVLHDVIEDTSITLDYLREQGFSEEVLAALGALTRRAEESYDEFISRVISNKTACHVKLADLSDNMDLSRIDNPTEVDRKRVEKYRKASERIIEALEEMGDTEYIDTKEIEISGCVEVPESVTEDYFTEQFIRFIERNNWYFGGGIREVRE